MKDESLETIGEAVLRLMQTYCDCPLNNTKFHNSTSTCSSGTVTFSSTLAHASEDGTVTATVLIETFEAGLSKEDHPTITVYGQELTVSLLVDEDSSSSSSTFLFSTAIVSAILVGVVVCIIISGLANVLSYIHSKHFCKINPPFTVIA